MTGTGPGGSALFLRRGDKLPSSCLAGQAKSCRLIRGKRDLRLWPCLGLVWMQKVLEYDTVAFLYLFDKHCPIIE